MKTKCKYCKKPIVYQSPTTDWHGFSHPLYCPWCNRKLKTAPPNKTYPIAFKGRCEA